MFFSLRKLLSFLLFAFFLSACSNHAIDNTPVPEEIKKAAAALTKAGIPLQSDPAGNIRWIEAKNGEFNSDKVMRYLPDLNKLEWLEIGKGKLSAKGLKYLQKCTGLKRLYIHDMDLEGEDLSWISGLDKLEALALQNTKINGSFLKNLNGNETLRVLNLSGNNISDADMEQIALIKNLEVLSLADTKISGIGIQALALKEMARLNELNVERCIIRDYDLSYLMKMPNLRIVYATGSEMDDMAINRVISQFPVLAIFK